MRKIGEIMKLKYTKLLLMGFTMFLMGCQMQDNKKEIVSPTPIMEDVKAPSSLAETTENTQKDISTEHETESNDSEERNKTELIEIDLSSYFHGHNGSAVIYRPELKTYEVYNLEASKEQRSPCSTFKIVSTLAALEHGIITEDNSLREWNGDNYWNKAWNKDISLTEAFQQSCVWYYRKLLDEIGQDRMQLFLNSLDYGNKDITDFSGSNNKNNSNPTLTGFWIESSLKISPYEQVKVLERIFGPESTYEPKHIDTLKNIMLVDQDVTERKIYGKTGYGKLNNVSLDSWFVGMYEMNSELIYFAVHLSESEDPEVSSALAKSIALQIIANH